MIKDILNGKFSKHFLTHRFLPIMEGFMAINLLLAWLLFPAELNYNIIDNSISQLGSTQDNPNGWIFFSIGMISWGFLLIPIFLYFHRRLNKICKHTARLGTFFALIGSIFIALIGVVPDDNIDIFGENLSDIHVIVAVVGFSGLGLGILFYQLPILKDSFFKRGNKQFSLGMVFGAYGLIFLGGIGMGTAEIIKEIEGLGFPGPGLLSFPFWEWMLLLFFFIFLIFASFFMPEEAKMLKDKK